MTVWNRVYQYGEQTMCSLCQHTSLRIWHFWNTYHTYIRIILCQQQSLKLIEAVMGTALEADHLSWLPVSLLGQPTAHLMRWRPSSYVLWSLTASSDAGVWVSPWVFKAGQGCEACDVLVLESVMVNQSLSSGLGWAPWRDAFHWRYPWLFSREISVLLWAGREPWLDSQSWKIWVL